MGKNPNIILLEWRFKEKKSALDSYIKGQAAQKQLNINNIESSNFLSEIFEILDLAIDFSQAQQETEEFFALNRFKALFCEHILKKRSFKLSRSNV